MNRPVVLFLLALLLFSSTASSATERRLHVIPAPKNVVGREGSFDFSNGVNIFAPDTNNKTIALAARQIHDEILIDTGIDAPVLDKLPINGTLFHFIYIGIARKEDPTGNSEQKEIPGNILKTPEGYVLDIATNTISITGADADGAYWAAQTLKLIIRGDRAGATIPSLLISDKPGFHFRGIELDVSRGPIPTDNAMHRIIDRLSELKINKLTLYIENVFCFKTHPDIPPEGGCYTADQISEIKAYAKLHGIKLVGGLQSFGHSEKLLSIPRYKPLSESQDRPAVLSPANPGAYELLKDLYSEIVPLFDSELFVIDCDETGGLGEGQSRAMADKIGMEGVYAYHINKLNEMLKPYGKRPLMWADIALEHPKILGLLPKNVILLPWEYHVQTSFDKWLKPLADAGYDTIASAGITNWSRIFPETETAIADNRQFALDGARYKSMGIINSIYHDDGETLNGYNWFPLAFGAEAAWNPESSDPGAFKANFSAAFFGDSSGRMSKAIRFISDAQNIQEMEYLADKSFMAWPPNIVTPNLKAARSEAKRCEELMNRALANIEAARPNLLWNADNADYIAFAASRIRSVARHKIAYADMADLFNKISADPQNRDAALAAFDKMAVILAAITKDTQATLAEYRRLWMAENRPYFFIVNEQKYNDLISRIENTGASIAAAKRAFMDSGRIPQNIKELGL